MIKGYFKKTPSKSASRISKRAKALTTKGCRWNRCNDCNEIFKISKYYRSIRYRFFLILWTFIFVLERVRITIYYICLIFFSVFFSAFTKFVVFQTDILDKLKPLKYLLCSELTIDRPFSCSTNAVCSQYSN